MGEELENRTIFIICDNQKHVKLKNTDFDEKEFEEAIEKAGINMNEEEKEFEKLKDACEKVVALLRHDENYNPHMTVIIKADEIKVVSDEVNIPLK